MIKEYLLFRVEFLELLVEFLVHADRRDGCLLRADSLIFIVRYYLSEILVVEGGNDLKR